MRVLIVLTSSERLGGLQRTGAQLESFVGGYYTFLDAALDVAVCSPLGGPVPITPEPAECSWHDLMQRFCADLEARAELSDTLMLSQICAADFSGVYFADGPGAASDLVDNTDSKNLILEMMEFGHPCAFVGYGLAALLKIQSPNGEPLVFNRRIAVSTTDKNAALGGPGFSLGREFAKLGASIVEGQAPLRIAQDGNLITGPETASSIEAARALVMIAMDKAP
jgi:putative intracellular protease/amidase